MCHSEYFVKVNTHFQLIFVQAHTAGTGDIKKMFQLIIYKHTDIIVLTYEVFIYDDMHHTTGVTSKNLPFCSIINYIWGAVFGIKMCKISL